jgi:hypothetical protein
MQNGREQCKRPFRVTRSIMITDSALDFFVTFHYIILFHSILFHLFIFFFTFDGKKIEVTEVYRGRIHFEQIIPNDGGFRVPSFVFFRCSSYCHTNNYQLSVYLGR